MQVFQKGVYIEEILMKVNMFIFLIKDNELLEKFNETQEKVNSIIKEFDSDTEQNE